MMHPDPGALVQLLDFVARIVEPQDKPKVFSSSMPLRVRPDILTSRVGVSILLDEAPDSLCGLGADQERDRRLVRVSSLPLPVFVHGERVAPGPNHGEPGNTRSALALVASSASFSRCSGRK